MKTKKKDIVIEELSYIVFDINKESIVLIDELRDKRFEINKTAYDICCAIDGCISLRDIARSLSQEYNIELSEIEDDVWSFYEFLKNNKLIICKGNLIYHFIKFYNFIIFQSCKDNN